MMELSDELVQGLAMGKGWLRTSWEQVASKAALAEDEAMCIIGDGAPRPGVATVLATIVFPVYTTREDFDRMTQEIMAALQQAEHRGERKALAFLLGEGSGTPVGIVRQPEPNSTSRESNDNKKG